MDGLWVGRIGVGVGPLARFFEVGSWIGGRGRNLCEGRGLCATGVESAESGGGCVWVLLVYF